MYLRELRIQGFKSFADPTLLPLKPGVTAIVGPNGCGKSNIADALRWVLGEQSTKSLRADSMADVIFQGTTQRKPLSLCEVSLTFADCEKSLGTSFNELEVTRRVSREGSSDYFLNGKSARLRDIQLLFLGTGVGQVSYSFLLQGRIDQILSSNPAERRAIFEEAAGISRYKTQRRETLDKLHAVEADLARVGDVLEEVGKRIASLRRQASKALRHKLASERARHLEKALAAWRKKELERDTSYAGALLEGTRTRMLAARAEMEKTGETIAAEREERTRASAALRLAEENVFALRSARDKAVAAADTAALRRSDCEAHLKALRAELADMDAEKAALEDKAAARRLLREKQMEILGSGDSELSIKETGLAGAKKALEAAERELFRLRRETAEAESRLTRQRTTIARLGAESASADERLAALEVEAKALGEENAKDREGSAKLSGERTKAEEAVKKADAARRSADEASLHAAELLRRAQGEVAAAEREGAELATKARMLAEIAERLEGVSGGSKALLQGKIATVPASACRLFTSLFEVDAKWAGAVALLVGLGGDAVALAEGTSLPALARELAAKKAGSARLVPPPDGAQTAVTEPLPPPPALAVLPLVSDLKSGDAPLLSSVFSGTLLFETLEEFLRWKAVNPAFPFRAAATADGALVDSLGNVVISGGGNAESQLVRAGRLRELQALSRRNSEKTGTLRSAAASAKGVHEAALSAGQKAASAASALAQELASLRGQERAFAERLARSEERLRQKQAERDRLAAARAKSAEELKKAEAELSAADAAAARLAGGAADAEKAVAADRAGVEKIRAEYESFRLDVAGRRQRLEIAHREVAESERMLAEWTLRHQKREGEAARDEGLLASLEKDAAAGKMETARLDGELAAAHKLVEERRDASAATARRASAAEEKMESVRKSHEALFAEFSTREIALAKLRNASEALETETKNLLGAELAELDWRLEMFLAGTPAPERASSDEDELPEIVLPPEPPPPSPAVLAAVPVPDWTAVRADAAAAKAKLDAMGAVNALAIEEYRDLRERHGFLKTQSDDLWASREKLLATISDINKTSSELFRDTFDKIRANFRGTFTALFGGGEADLTLDEGDLLESGVEIMARPPGTRLRSVTLLSGGQKTMTAMALLFAIYMVRPSPFCVLDEIDAPLDEANVNRFMKMLGPFQEKSQFFIITHNKHTIAASDTIFGVTMEERGVSKIVSMRLAEAVAAEDVAPPVVQ